uniref:Nudix (Nucleoside diphosphate linked moiety X)-type motif 12 n=2 Tax=Nothobranchius kuhntae TaxID=321403 RepID=A0A1A8I3W7_NOTKU
MVEKFLDAAARGDLSQVSALLSHTPSLINQTGYSGWTALMLAARNGHHQVVERLLSLGCDKFSANSSSQTAYDVAKFWGHRHIADLLSRSDDQCQRVLPAADLVPQENYFSRETLDRLSAKRTDESQTLAVSFCACQMDAKLCRFRYEAVKDLLQKPSTVLIFLGAERKKTPGSSSSSGTEEGSREPPVWFAINTDEDPAELLKRCREKSCSFPKSPNRDLLKFSEDEAGVVAQARSVLAWHSRYSFCSTCGSGTRLEEGGYKRSCLNSQCRSLQGVHNTCYPRVDPVVIMLAVHPDGNQCLLGRKKPWPMPSNLMIGCLAVAISTHIKVDENEIEEARWFPRQQVIDSLLRGASQALVLPPRQTIAHQLIRHWISVNSNL